jgi:hypothetical protein
MRLSFLGGSLTKGRSEGGGQLPGGDLGRRVEKELGGQPDKKVLTLAPDLQAGSEGGGEGGLRMGSTLEG